MGVISEWFLCGVGCSIALAAVQQISVTGEDGGLLIPSPGCALTIHYPNPCARFISVNEITAGWE